MNVCEERKDLPDAAVSRVDNRTVVVSLAGNRTHGWFPRREVTIVRTGCYCSGENHLAAVQALPHPHLLAAAVLKAPLLSHSQPTLHLLLDCCAVALSSWCKPLR